MHPQGGARQEHALAGQGGGNGPQAPLLGAKKIDRLRSSQNADQQPGVQSRAPQHLHVLGRKRAQDGGEGTGRQMGHGGVTRYRNETSHIPSWTSLGLRRHSELAACG